MNRAEALAEARRRWGKKYARVYTTAEPAPNKNEGPIILYEVGVLIEMYRDTEDPNFEVQGAGLSWEDAFADADRRGARSMA